MYHSKKDNINKQHDPWISGTEKKSFFTAVMKKNRALEKGQVSIGFLGEKGNLGIFGKLDHQRGVYLEDTFFGDFIQD